MFECPRLVTKTLLKENLWFDFAPRQTSSTPLGMAKSAIELAARNFPSPDQFSFGKDPRYSRWTNSRFETFVPRRKLPATRMPFPLAVAIVATRDATGEGLTLTTNSLRAAGLPIESIFLIDAALILQSEMASKSITYNELLGLLPRFDQDSYVMCLRDGDTVSRDLLDICSDKISKKNPNFIYLDHDRLDHDGSLFEFVFKPDRSPNTLLFRNYPSRAAMAKISLLTELIDRTPRVTSTGIFGLMYGCAIAASNLDDSQMVHIPIPAIHLRNQSQFELTECARQEQFARNQMTKIYAPNLSIDSSPQGGATWHSKSESRKTVSILIPTRNRHDLLKSVVDSIVHLTKYPLYEIVVIDNQSDEPATIALLEELSHNARISVRKFDEPFNFARMHNETIPELDTDCVLMLNNDTEVTDSFWLTRLVDLLSLENVGVVGNKLLYPDGTIQHAGATGGLKGPMAHHLVGLDDVGINPQLSFPRDVLAVTAACLLMPRSLYLECGGMDEKLAISYNDMDLCLLVRASTGKAVVVSSSGGVIHKESKSRGKMFSADQQKLLNDEAEYFESKWHDCIRPDRFYNPNLSLERDFDLC